MPFCWKCGATLNKDAKKCSECGREIGSNELLARLDFFGDKKQFIVEFNFGGPKGKGRIMDLDMNTLLDFEFGWTLKPPYKAGLRGCIPGKSWALDFQLSARGEALVGDICGFPPPLFSATLRYVWEIYNSKNELKGRVWEKLRGLLKSGSDWILENPAGNVIATFQGDRENKNYYIMTEDNEIIARCYKDSEISDAAQRVDILRSEPDTFLVLCYILVLDLAERFHG